MMEIRKELPGILAAEVSEEDLAQINALAKSELKAEDIYTFAVKLCDNEVDRDFERFSVSALETLGELFLGKSGIFDHDWSAAGQTARIYRTELGVESGTRTEAGDAYRYLKGYAYMLRSEKNAELIREIEGGIKKEVSVGCSVKRSVCSICGRDMNRGECQHRKGLEYDGRLCYAELQEPTDAYEWSFVAVPAQRSAGVMKKRFGRGAGAALKDYVAESGSADLQAELEQLQELAEHGRTYMAELRKDVKRLMLMTEKGLGEDMLLSVTEKLGEKELKELRGLYEEKAARQFGVQTQLLHKARKPETDGEAVFCV